MTVHQKTISWHRMPTLCDGFGGYKLYTFNKPDLLLTLPIQICKKSCKLVPKMKRIRLSLRVTEVNSLSKEAIILKETSAQERKLWFSIKRYILYILVWFMLLLSNIHERLFASTCSFCNIRREPLHLRETVVHLFSHISNSLLGKLDVSSILL